MNSQLTSEVLDVLSEWVYKNRVSMLIDAVNRRSRGKSNGAHPHDITDDFISDLKKL